MFHTIADQTLYRLLLSPAQRKALRRLGNKRKNFFQRFSVLVNEIMSDNDLTILASHSRTDACRLGESRMESFRQERKEIDSLKENCRHLGVPQWMIDYESP